MIPDKITVVFDVPEQIQIDNAGMPVEKFFSYAHLPPDLQVASAPFYAVAMHLVATTKPSAERTVALRKLLEGKDAAVRAAMLSR